MLGENIKTLRKNKGLTQEELAIRLKVVRQTVSKWEKGYSVPDAETLQKIADILEVDIKQLLGADIETEKTNNEVAEQLSRINEQLAIKNRRSRRIWKTIGIILLTILVLYILLAIAGLVFYVPTSDKIVIDCFSLI
ncbi:MAG: helix-turn-helix domain-containing protein [Intestinibacter sp.]|uniref:helix-turn-helix domain-containing protein n=1 Tax=Intestinibacter sp. TaxID=1965304 RepID=UPI0025C4BCDD|nr:helix-turn-helix domain-containing protein [Intestinibacter sp.]MCI6738816.1 helix-turn-helix domain-containing protein [Intestinibacter sp.]